MRNVIGTLMLGALLAAGLFSFAGPAQSAGLGEEEEPMFLLADKVEKDHLEMLKGFDFVLKDQAMMAPLAKSRHGLAMLLQSPKQENNPEGKDIYLFLRFVSAYKDYPVLFNPLGKFSIEVLDMTRGDIEAGVFAFSDKTKETFLKEGRDVIKLAPPEHGVPEVLVVFNLGDFGLLPLAAGTYRIKITYTSESPDNSIWTGHIDSNALLVEVK